MLQRVSVCNENYKKLRERELSRLKEIIRETEFHNVVIKPRNEVLKKIIEKLSS